MPWQILLLALWLMSGCVQGTVTLVEPSRTYPATTSLEILREKPARPHRTIAVVRATGLPSATNAELCGVLQKEAKSIGADAILLLPREENVSIAGSNPCAGGAVNGAGEKVSVLKALAIKYE
jgi:hypothetical protein